MFNSIRKKIILLYTCSTGFILIAVLIFALLYSNNQMLQGKKDSFFNHFITVSRSVQTGNVVTHLWMAELEEKNHIILNIEDNGVPLLYKGAWKSETERELLVDKVKKLAQQDNVYTSVRPVSLKEIQSKTYQLKGSGNDRYLGAVFVVPAASGYRSVVMLQNITEDTNSVVKQAFFVVFLAVLGIGALFLVSRWIVGKTLRPVEESRRRQTEFIAAASHELKSPLAVIRANASAVLVEPERMEHFIRGIDKECIRMSRLTEDMLLLASADAKSWEVKKEIVDMDHLLIETYETFYPFCRKNGRELRLEMPEEMLPPVRGDRERIRQMLAVLIDNAVSYTKEEDVIILRAYAKKNLLWMEVEDHGEGIGEEEKKEIFERFYRKDKSRKDKSHYGLGLSIAKELVELQEGSIFVKDTAGQGATFCISLPVEK